ncbi:MAG: hypothetical protein ACEQSU_14910 [Microgenomates group bacterium]
MRLSLRGRDGAGRAAPINGILGASSGGDDARQQRADSQDKHGPEQVRFHPAHPASTSPTRRAPAISTASSVVTASAAAKSARAPRV